HHLFHFLARFTKNAVNGSYSISKFVSAKLMDLCDWGSPGCYRNEVWAENRRRQHKSFNRYLLHGEWTSRRNQGRTVSNLL
ncbi:MAG TPA: hypothetical protein VFY67_12900, partial [Pyrinomonadaceae bacterium]|nr:hypothetical protein [Pyrinomonadaceae bacterium]